MEPGNTGPACANRWRVATALGDVHGWCWTSLVLWALHGESRLRDCRDDRACIAEATRQGHPCFCMRILPDGRRLKRHQGYGPDGIVDRRAVGRGATDA